MFSRPHPMFHSPPFPQAPPPGLRLVMHLGLLLLALFLLNANTARPLRAGNIPPSEPPHAKSSLNPSTSIRGRLNRFGNTLKSARCL